VHTFSPRIDTMPGLRRFFALTTAAFALSASPVLAQAIAGAPAANVTPSAVTETPAEIPAPSGPTLDNATSGIHANTAHEDLTAAEAAQRAADAGGHGGIGKGAVILIVGGAAIVGGILIGGAGGTALAIGGALVALYGIYLLLQ
jgi:hypothetical protein